MINCCVVPQVNSSTQPTPRVYSKSTKSRHYNFSDLDQENMDPNSAYVRNLLGTVQNLTDKLDKSRHNCRLKGRSNTSRKRYIEMTRRAMCTQAEHHLNQIRDSVTNRKILKAYEQAVAEARSDRITATLHTRSSTRNRACGTQHSTL